MRVLHLEKSCYDADSLQKLEAIGDVDYCNFGTAQEFHRHLQDNSYEVIITKLGFAIGVREMDLQPRLSHIITPTTGLNHIDLEAAKSRNINVVSLKGENDFLQKVQSTSEHTWMLLLSLVRKLIPAQADVKKGNWTRIPHLADELNTTTIGIIGLGRIGKMLVQYAKAFSMKILCNDVDESVFAGGYEEYQTPLKDLLAQSDYVILQVDYRPENHHFFNDDKFSDMKQGSYFINTSRGEIVEERALLNALKSSKLKGAAVDVLEGDSSWESRMASNALINYAQENNNLIITPHMGGYGRISIEMTRAFVTKKFLRTI